MPGELERDGNSAAPRAIWAVRRTVTDGADGLPSHRRLLCRRRKLPSHFALRLFPLVAVGGERNFDRRLGDLPGSHDAAPGRRRRSEDDGWSGSASAADRGWTPRPAVAWASRTLSPEVTQRWA